MIEYPAPPLGMASSFTVLALDWLVYVGVSSAPMPAFALTLALAVLAALSVYLLESRGAADAFAPRSLRALGAGIAVAIPLPLYGSLLALACAVWTWLRARLYAR